MPHYLIICPLKKELTYLMEGFSKSNWKFKAQSTNRLSLFQNQSPMITLAIGGHGKVQFGIQTQHLLSHFTDVTNVFCIGAGGGLTENIKIGDIVVSEKIIEHDYKQKYNRTIKFPEFAGNPEFLLKAKNVSLNKNYDVHFGAIASGDEDIVDAERARELFTTTQALAVAWEGSGGARACAFNKIPYLELRTITDNSRDGVSESFAMNLQICMHNVANYIHELLKI